MFRKSTLSFPNNMMDLFAIKIDLVQILVLCFHSNLSSWWWMNDLIKIYNKKGSIMSISLFTSRFMHLMTILCCALWCDWSAMVYKNSSNTNNCLYLISVVVTLICKLCTYYISFHDSIQCCINWHLLSSLSVRKEYQVLSPKHHTFYSWVRRLSISGLVLTEMICTIDCMEWLCE